MPSSFESFILENAEAETTRLLLSSIEWPSPPADPGFSSFDGKELAVNTIESRRKLRDKVPEWFSRTSLVFPSALSAEQCSSSVTARYKASLTKRILGDYQGRIADLTGGLGVDTWAFSQVALEVLYNERELRLVAAARHNLQELGVRNVRYSAWDLAPDSMGTVLGDFQPDLIFLDPARRSSEGNKVFLLEDCSPDVLTLLPTLLGHSRHLLLKLSPMADISMVVERLDRTYEKHLESEGGSGWNGNWVREIHVVASGGECKELLVWMDREWKGEYSVTCREDGGSLLFSSEEIRSSKAVLPEAVDFQVLFEPGRSLSKAGAFNALCQRFGLVKLARSTNLFSLPSSVILSAPPVILSAPPVILSEAKDLCEVKDLLPMGKFFSVETIVRMNKTGLRDVGKKYPRSEVSARNIPLSTAELRSRLGVKSGDDAHIFGVRVETSFEGANFLLVCHRI